MLTSIAKVFKVNIFSPSAMNPGRRLLNLIVIKIRLFTLRRRRIKNKNKKIVFFILLVFRKKC